MCKMVVVEPEGVDVGVGGLDVGYEGRGSSVTHDYSCPPSSLVNRSTVEVSNQIHAAGFANGATLSTLRIL